MATGSTRVGLTVLALVALGAWVVGCGSEPEIVAPPMVDVGPTLDRIVFTPAEPHLTSGDSLTLGVAVFDSQGDRVVGATVEWSSSRPSIASVSREGTVGAGQAGRSVVRAHVRPPAGFGSGLAIERGVLVSVAEPDTAPPTGHVIAELPRETVDVSEPTTRRDIHVPGGSSLQAAINVARRGDRLLLTPGAVYGPVSLPPKSGDGWIVVETDVALPEGRMTPELAQSLNLATIQGKGGDPVIWAVGDVSHYRFQGVVVRADPKLSLQSQLVSIDTNRGLSTVLSQPSHVVLDRLYVHGNPPALQLKRCVGLNGEHVAVVNSSLHGCSKLGQDSQAIWIGDGLGPTAIINNHLQAGSELVMSGGFDPHISGIVPSDIEIRGNYFHRPASWKNGAIGVIKNLFEIKNARRVLVEDNIFEGNWSDGQSGWSILIKSTNQDGTCEWCTADDLTIRWNLLDDAENGLHLVWGNSIGAPHGETERVLVENNVFARLGANGNNPGWGTPLRLSQMPAHIVVRNNTFENAGSNHFLMFDGDGGTGSHIQVADNLGWNGLWGVWVGDGATLADGSVHGNVLIGGTGRHCGPNDCPGTVQLQSVSLSGLDYLLPNVEGKGAFVEALAARLAGVR